MANQTPTRRGMLGAMAAAAALASPATPAVAAAPMHTIQANEWTAAFREWRKADARANAIPGSDPNCDAMGDLESAAWQRLMMLPAPHGAALLWKLNYLWQTPGADGFSEGWSNDIVAAVMADANRLLGGVSG